MNNNSFIISKYQNNKNENVADGKSFLLSAQSFPSGKQRRPVPFSASLPQSSGNSLSMPVACGFFVPPMPPSLLDGEELLLVAGVSLLLQNLVTKINIIILVKL